MRNLLKLTIALFMVTLVFNACSKDDSPSSKDLFVGTYKGNLSYKTSDKNINISDGSVTVVKVGNNYDFKFSDNIPNLNGVEFKKDANSVISVGSDESKYIKVTASNLNIAFTKDGEVWTASCTR